MIKEITTYLKAGMGTSWVIGANLFAGFAPPGTEGDCVIVIESGGIPNFYLKDSQHKAVQVLSRAKDYHDAINNAMVVYRVLHGLAGITLTAIDEPNDILVNTISAISLPQSLGQDDRGLFIISTNYVFKLQAA